MKLAHLVVTFLFMMARLSQGLSNARSGNGMQQVYSISSAKAGENRQLMIYWFRLMDLRLHDNPALCKAVELVKHQSNDVGILPLFCFDPRIFGAKTQFGTLKCGPKRAKFIIESVLDLRKQLESRGSGLLVAHGKPEEVLFSIMKQANVGNEIVPYVVTQTEVCSEELAIDKAVRASITKHHPRATLETVWGSTLYEIKDLPFQNGLNGMPDVFTPFRNKMEKLCKIGNPLPVPNKGDLKLASVDVSMENCSFTYIPSLPELGYTPEDVSYANSEDPRGVMKFQGGESAALARVKDYIWEKDLLKIYFDTRNGMIGPNYSTKFAPWLAHGCLSPRFVARECQKYEGERVANKSTYWVVFELLWRDFFKFFAMKHGNKIFLQGGTMDSDQKWKFHEPSFSAWKEGRTGYPLVDANMRELAATGFMSNRGRQNVCSFLALDMKIDWRYGADYFESTLLDYDVHSNWGNWVSGAGMTGGRINRFNIVKQSKDYDQHGDYVRQWLPELKNLPNEFIHEPWKMTQFQQLEYGVKLGVDYPNPIIPPLYPNPNGGADSGGRGHREQKRKDFRGGNNKNRGRGQREDMKSLPQGSIRMK